MGRLTLFALVFALAFAGCIENMGDLKETLGVKAPVAPEPPAPTYLPPVAKVQASATNVLVGETVTFTSEGSKDGQQLPLDLAWDFGDRAVGRGATTSHAYLAPGEYAVRLVVTNTAGLTDDDRVVVKVTSLDRAPTAALRVTDAKGAVTTRGMMDAPITFESLATDPESKPLTTTWDLGDGATSAEPRVIHTYTAPGAYDVTLRVVDPARHDATASTRVLIDGAWTKEGAFEPGGASSAQLPIVVAAAAKTLSVKLTFDAGMGLNDLQIVILDATGAEVARSSGSTTPGTQGDLTREIALEQFDAPGAWIVQVVRERGLSAAWSLAISETM